MEVRMDKEHNTPHKSSSLQAAHMPRCKPEEQQVDSSSIYEFIRKIEEDELELHSLMMIRNGQVIVEGSWSPYQASDAQLINSLSKSFTSTAIGIAVDEGILAVEDRVISFFPEEVTEEIEANMNELTIHHLLTMSTGHAEDTMPYLHGQNNWVKAFLEVPITYKPGTHFLYNTGASYMLSAILHKASGENLLDYLQPRLFNPLDIYGVTSLTCPVGIHAGGFGMFMKVEDIAKLGLLYLQEGTWNGKQIISKQWANTAIQKHVPNGHDINSDWAQGYGYQFWRCRHGVYRGDGAFGQFCIVLPDKQTVIAMTGGAMEMQMVLDHVWETLLPGIKDDNACMSLTDSNTNADANASPSADAQFDPQLLNKIHSLAYPPICNRVKSPVAYERWNGKTYRVSGPYIQIQGLRFQFTDDHCTMTLTDVINTQTLTIGIGAWVSNELRLGNTYTKVSASGGWVKKNKFEIQLRFLDQAYVDIWACHFVNDSVKVTCNRNVWIVPGLSDDVLLPTLVGSIYEDRDMWIGNSPGTVKKD